MMGLVERNFLLMKPVPEGYLYRLPSRWVFGPARHYLLSEPQRERLVAALDDPHPARTGLIGVAIIFGIAFVVVAIVATAVTFLDRSAAGSGILAGILASTSFLAALYGVALVLTRATIRRVHAALPDLRPTERRMTRVEIRDAADALISPKLRLSLAGMFAIAFAATAIGLGFELSTMRALGLTQVLRACGCLAFGWLAIMHFRRWLKERDR